jgi:uncharacterized protein YutE (UPF0331/DUF86 family)
VVDEGRVSRLLRAIEDRVSKLRRAAADAPAAPEGTLWLDGVKYLFVTAIEGCVDVAQHIAASERFPAPASNAGAVRLLGERGVVDGELADRLGRAVGFRNVLVHQYAEVDDRVVLEQLNRLDDLEDFVGQVSAWLLRSP